MVRVQERRLVSGSGVDPGDRLVRGAFQQPERKRAVAHEIRGDLKIEIRGGSQDVVPGELGDGREDLLPLVVVDGEVGRRGGERGPLGDAVARVDDGGGGDAGNQRAEKSEEAHKCEGGHGGRGADNECGAGELVLPQQLLGLPLYAPHLFDESLMCREKRQNIDSCTRNARAARWQDGNSHSFEIIRRVSAGCTGLPVQEIKRDTRARMGVLQHQCRQQVAIGSPGQHTRFGNAPVPIWPIP